MALQIRRGTNAERLTITPLEGELIFCTDTQELWIGDGTTVGGVEVSEDQNLGPTSDVTFNKIDITTTGTFNNVITNSLKVNYWGDITYVRSSYMRGITGTNVVIENGSNVGGKIELNDGEGAGVTLSANSETIVATFNTATSEIKSDTVNIKSNSGTQRLAIANGYVRNDTNTLFGSASGSDAFITTNALGDDLWLQTGATGAVAGLGGKIAVKSGSLAGVDIYADSNQLVAEFSTGTTKISSYLEVDGNVMPHTASLDLGSAENPWRGVYTKGLRMLADDGTYGHIFGPRGDQSWSTANIEFRASSSTDEVKIYAYNTATSAASYVWVKNNAVELSANGNTASLGADGNFQATRISASGGDATYASFTSVGGNVDVEPDGFPEYHHFLEAGCYNQDSSDILSKHFRVNNTGTLQITNDANDTVIMSLTDSGVLQTKGFAETVYDLGTGSGTINPDANSATIFKLTLNGNWTLSSIANAVTGTNATILVKQDGTGGRTLTTSTGWLFAGGAKTLTTSPNAVDMINTFYDGTNYYASLSRGFL